MVSPKCRVDSVWIGKSPNSTDNFAPSFDRVWRPLMRAYRAYCAYQTDRRPRTIRATALRYRKIRIMFKGFRLSPKLSYDSAVSAGRANTAESTLRVHLKHIFLTTHLLMRKQWNFSDERSFPLVRRNHYDTAISRDIIDILISCAQLLEAHISHKEMRSFGYLSKNGN